jgi:hypothetical protein
MSIKRYGTVQTGAGGKPLPFARAVEANGWLYVSGQVAMENGEIIDGNIIAQTHKTIANLLAILKEADYGPSISFASASGSMIRATSGPSTRSIRNISASIRRRAPACRRR